MKTEHSMGVIKADHLILNNQYDFNETYLHNIGRLGGQGTLHNTVIDTENETTKCIGLNCGFVHAYIGLSSYYKDFSFTIASERDDFVGIVTEIGITDHAVNAFVSDFKESFLVTNVKGRTYFTVFIWIDISKLPSAPIRQLYRNLKGTVVNKNKSQVNGLMEKMLTAFHNGESGFIELIGFINLLVNGCAGDLKNLSKIVIQGVLPLDVNLNAFQTMDLVATVTKRSYGNMEYAIDNEYYKGTSVAIRHGDFISLILLFSIKRDFTVELFNGGSGQQIIGYRSLEILEDTLFPTHMWVCKLLQGKSDKIPISYKAGSKHLIVRSNFYAIPDFPITKDPLYFDMTPQVYELFKRILLEMQSDDIDLIEINYLVSKIIQYQRNQLKMKMNLIETVKQEDQKRLSEVEAYVHGNICEKICIEDVLDICAMSESKFRQLFKEVYKVPFKTYVRQEKVRHASILLESGEYQVCEIADKLRFTNPSHFTRTFKKLRGVLPKQFK